MSSSTKSPSQEREGCRPRKSVNRRGPSHAGPYGLACSNCFKAKSKCVAVPGTETSACRRCHRLEKKCQPSDSIRRHGVSKKIGTSTSRIAELEGKVDSLLMQLRSRNGWDLAEPVRELTPEGNIMPSIEVDSDMSGQTDLADAKIEERTRSDLHRDALLSKFRRHMLPNFPFMHLPDTFTAKMLETEWPLLFTAITFVASSSPGKVLRGQELKKSLCEALLEFDNNPTMLKRIGLFLAILTYLAWGYDCILYDGSMPRLMTQAVSLATELVQDDYIESGNLMKPAAQLFGHDQQQEAGTSIRQDFFLDRRRAILGCFVLSSAISAYFGRVNTFRWTMQMEESLAAVRANKDCPSDQEFSLLVRLQLLIEKASQVQLQQKTKYQNYTIGATASPYAISLLSLRNELQGLGAALPSMVTNKATMMAQLHSTESRLGQITHAVFSTVPVMISQFQRMATSVSAGESIVDGTAMTKTVRTDQMISLWQCMQSSMDCVEALLDLAPGSFCHISFLQWSQITHSVACLYFLTHTIEDQGWDRQSVRARVDIPAILSRIIEKLQSASEIIGIEGSDSAFRTLAQKMSDLRASVVDDQTQHHATLQEAKAAWERLKAHGGGRGISPITITRLEDTFKRTRGPFDYVFE